jgi:regulator of RNase E activity RraA
MNANGDTISPDVIEALKQFDSPTIMNAIEQFDVRNRTSGYAGFDLRCMFPALPPMVGYAVTATADSTTPEATPDGRVEELFDLIDAAPKPCIVVVQNVGSEVTRSCFAGDMMSRTCQYLGAVGFVTDGGIRDLAGIAERAPGFQVFAGGLVVSHGIARIMDVDVPVDISGVPIRPGDLLHGDENGLGTVPIEIADDLPAMAQKVADKEATLFDVLKEPGRSLDEVKRALFMKPPEE